MIVEARLDSVLTLSWDDAALSLTWLSVQDSRCPDGITCVWEGEVGGRFALQPAGGEVSEQTMTRHHDGDPRATATVAGFQLRLLAVAPCPSGEAPTEPADYRALIAAVPPGQNLPDVVTAIDRSTWGYLKGSTDR